MTIATLAGLQAPAVKALLECADLAALKSYLGVSGGGSDPWTTIRLTSDYATSAVAASDVTGLGFAPAASTRYEVEARFYLQSAATTTGVRPGVAWPTGLTDGVVEISTAVTSTGVQIAAGNNVASVLSAAASHPTLTGSWPGRLWSIFETGAAPTGDFRIQLATEIATSQVTMKAGSFLRYRVVP